MGNLPISLRSENAYTDDDNPIKTIYVGNLSSEFTEKEVKQYFSKFGSVACVDIKRTSSKHAPCIYAFLTFEESESAAKALRLEKHEILSRRVVVNAADSWTQPKEKDATCKKSQFLLLDLNDDCLHHIASYLELRDLLNLSKTCKRLEGALEPIFASHKKLDVFSLGGLTLMDIHEILYKIGPHVQHLVYRSAELIGERLAIVEYVNQYRPPGNLWSLKHYKGNADFVSKNITSSLFKRLIKTFENLETLKCSIEDDMSAVISNCSNLQNLDLCESRDLTGIHLDILCNLQNLNLEECDNLQPEFFKNLCMKTKLVSLNIVGCKLLDYSSIETLASTQTKLENLSIRHDYKTSNLSPFATLKNLKRLRIECYYRSCDEFFQELAKHRGAELEVLGIWSCPFNHEVEQAINSLKKLKVLSVHYSKNITSIFLTKLAITPLECLVIHRLEPILEEGVLNLISKSETIKVFSIGDPLDRVDKRRLVLSAHDIIRKKERKYPLSLFTAGPCIIDGKLHEEPEFKPRSEFLKIIKKSDYLSQLPWNNSLNIF